jgi:outer membrane protein
MNKATALTLISATLATPAMAQDSQPQFSLGLGATYNDSPYLGYDDDVKAIPLINYRNGDFHIRGTELGYRVYQGTGQLELIGNLNTMEFDADESTDLSLLDDRDMAFEMGVRYRLDNFSVTALVDVSDTHEGERVNVNYAFPLSGNSKKSGIVPAVGLDWQSDSYNDYYYGVSSVESARTGGSIAAYDSGSSINPYFKVDAYYEIAPQWQAVANFRYTWLDDEISDSSMIEDDEDARISFGVKYHF